MECALDIYLWAPAGWQIYPSFLTATLHPPHKPAVHKKEEMETKRHLKEKKTKEHAQNRHGKVSSSSSEVNLEGWDCELWFVRNCLGRLGWANNLCCMLSCSRNKLTSLEAMLVQVKCRNISLAKKWTKKTKMVRLSLTKQDHQRWMKLKASHYLKRINHFTK